MILDDIDKTILRELTGNSRLSMRELAKKVGLSAPSVTERVRKLENEGVINQYTIAIDYSKIGYGMDCFMEVTLRHGEYDRFRKVIEESPNAEFCYRLAGKACYLIKLRLRGLYELEDFINKIAGNAEIVTQIALSQVPIKNNLLKT